MKFTDYLIFANLYLLTNLHQTIADRLPHIRGVSISDGSIYSLDSEIFRCNGGKTIIEFDRVNDDYCDCEDGSDEPGTSACPLGKFHCNNQGHKPKNIPSSRVNDGICDCCDATDEYNTGSECTNTCFKIDQEEQIQRKHREKLFEDGAALCAELINKGKQLKDQRLALLSALNQRKMEHEAIRTEKEQLKNEAEKAEAEALEAFRLLHRAPEEGVTNKTEEETRPNLLEAHQFFKKHDKNEDGVLEIDEILVVISLDKDRNGVVTTEEAQYFLDDHDSIDLDSFVTLSWPRIKPYLMLSQGIFKPPVTDEEPEVNSQYKLDNLPLDADMDDSKGIENPDDFEADDGYDDKEEGDHEGSVVEENTTKTPEYDPETEYIIKLANDARNALSEEERQINEIENKIKDIENQNAKDYGSHEEYASMDGECFTYEDREYIYKLCPFDRASQQQRNGGSETTLGRWDKWDGPELNKYSQMKYSNGASCWNGPQRSAVVQLKCALENKISSVTEPNRCEYFFVFETPAHCKPLSIGNNMLHDEL